MLIASRQLKLYIFIAVASLFFTLWLPYIHEEGIYTISAYEMWYHQHYLINDAYNVFYGRPPLLNWFIIPLASWLGWQHVLIASRLVSAFSTTAVVLGLYWFVSRLTENTLFALLCTAIYLTGDLLFIRGWLAYADPLLSFFIFFSMVFLWLGVEETRNSFLIGAVICLSAAFLVKALSPYWFYGLAGLVLLVLHPNRKFLLRPTSIAVHVLSLIFPFVWNAYTDPRYLMAMWAEATSTAFSSSFEKYIYKIFVVQPGLLLLRLAPISLVALFYYFKTVRNKSEKSFQQITTIAFWIMLLNFIICWFAPRWPEARYYMPVFPLMAMCMAYVIWNAGANAKKITIFLLFIMLAGKTLFVAYDYYRYRYFEPNYKAEAQDIVRIVGNAPIGADVHTIESSPVEKVVAYLNPLRYPKRPISAIPTIEQKTNSKYTDASEKGCNGIYVIGQLPASNDRIIKQYAQGKRLVYLFCRD